MDKLSETAGSSYPDWEFKELVKERDTLKAELAIAKSTGTELLKQKNKSAEHISILRKRIDAAEAELEDARKQEPDSWRVTSRRFCGSHTTDKSVADHFMPSGEAYPLYKNPMPEKLSKGVAQVLIHAAITENPELLDLFAKPVPAQPSPAVAVPEMLPYWPPCNPGCDPEFNGQRSKYCAERCKPARDAMLSAAPTPPKVPPCDTE